jgi:hypothetical protein
MSCSWFINRASAIKSVHVSATLSLDQRGDAARDLLERQLPLLAEIFSHHATALTLACESNLTSTPCACMFFCVGVGAVGKENKYRYHIVLVRCRT